MTIRKELAKCFMLKKNRYKATSDEAIIEFIKSLDFVTTSLLQKKFSIGYHQAFDIVAKLVRIGYLENKNRYNQYNIVKSSFFAK